LRNISRFVIPLFSSWCPLSSPSLSCVFGANQHHGCIFLLRPVLMPETQYVGSCSVGMIAGHYHACCGLKSVNMHVSVTFVHGTLQFFFVVLAWVSSFSCSVICCQIWNVCSINYQSVHLSTLFRLIWIVEKFGICMKVFCYLLCPNQG
jgi:hypothetical protein